MHHKFIIPNFVLQYSNITFLFLNLHHQTKIIMKDKISITIKTFYKIGHYHQSGIIIDSRKLHKLFDKLKANKILFYYNSCPVHGDILIVMEPNFKINDQGIWERIAHKILNIKGGDICGQPKLTGDMNFWNLFDSEWQIFILYGFSHLNNDEIGAIYGTGASTIEAKFTYLFNVIRPYYPSPKKYNRVTFRLLGIRLKVHCMERCDKCNQFL